MHQRREAVETHRMGARTRQQAVYRQGYATFFINGLRLKGVDVEAFDKIIGTDGKS